MDIGKYYFNSYLVIFYFNQLFHKIFSQLIKHLSGL